MLIEHGFNTTIKQLIGNRYENLMHQLQTGILNEVKVFNRTIGKQTGDIKLI